MSIINRIKRYLKRRKIDKLYIEAYELERNSTSCYRAAIDLKSLAIEARMKATTLKAQLAVQHKVWQQPKMEVKR